MNTCYCGDPKGVHWQCEENHIKKEVAANNGKPRSSYECEIINGRHGDILTADENGIFRCERCGF